MTLEETLNSHPFTQDLSAQHLAKLAVLAETAVFQENQVLLQAGDRAVHFYLVLSGSVSVELASSVCSVRIDAIGPGGAFGWSSLLESGNTLFRVRTRESTTALRMDGQQVVGLCHRDKELCSELLGRRLPELMAARLRGTEAKLAEFCGMAAATRDVLDHPSQILSCTEQQE